MAPRRHRRFPGHVAGDTVPAVTQLQRRRHRLPAAANDNPRPERRWRAFAVTLAGLSIAALAAVLLMA
ncbi:MAG: hypothetical protein AB7N54_09600 [Alphaproteobacteria bacterium]